MINLRPHQEQAIQMLRQSLRSGKRRPILAAPCSFGKTITAAALMASVAARGKRGIFICDRIKLVQQSLEEFTNHGLQFGVIQGNHELTNRHAPIQIASIQMGTANFDDFTRHQHHRDAHQIVRRHTVLKTVRPT